MFHKELVPLKGDEISSYAMYNFRRRAKDLTVLDVIKIHKSWSSKVPFELKVKQTKCVSTQTDIIIQLNSELIDEECQTWSLGSVASRPLESGSEDPNSDKDDLLCCTAIRSGDGQNCQPPEKVEGQQSCESELEAIPPSTLVHAELPHLDDSPGKDVPSDLFKIVTSSDVSMDSTVSSPDKTKLVSGTPEEDVQKVKPTFSIFNLPKKKKVLITEDDPREVISTLVRHYVTIGKLPPIVLERRDKFEAHCLALRLDPAATYREHPSFVTGFGHVFQDEILFYRKYQVWPPSLRGSERLPKEFLARHCRPSLEDDVLG